MNFRKYRNKRNVDVEEFDITSLLDILVILLVFLLKSFNDSELTLDLVNELALPYSQSRLQAEHGLIVQVNKRKIVYLNEKKLGSINGYGLTRLQKDLREEFQKSNARLKAKGLKEADNKLINLVFDQGLNYLQIHKVLDTVSDAGYGQYKLIVQAPE